MPAIYLPYQAPLLITRINLNPSMDKYIHHKMWDEIIYTFPDINRRNLGMDN